MANRIQYRRDTAANWTAANPVLSNGEPGYETDTKKRKTGDGITAWKDLSYAPDAASVEATAKASTLRPAAAVRPLQPLVVFTFDDNPRSDLTSIKPILDAKGVKATFCAVTSSVSTTGFLTWAELRQLQSEGHEIVNHSATHISVSGVSAAVLKSEIADPYDAFVANGIKPTGYCYPGGNHDAAARAEVRKNHAYALTVGNASIVQPVKSYALDRKSLDNSTTLATHQAEVDAALAGGYVLIYLIHSGGLDAAALTKLGSLIDYIKAKPIPIVTAAQAVATVGNLVDTGDQSGGKYSLIDGSGKLWASDANVNTLAGVGRWQSRKAPGITNSLEILSENTGVVRWAFSEALLTGYASDGTSTRMVLDAGDSPTSRLFSNIFSGTGQHLTFQNNGTQVLGVERTGEIRFYDSLKQTTVGAAGAAAALPAAPTAYFKVKTQSGTSLVIPAYLAA